MDLRLAMVLILEEAMDAAQDTRRCDDYAELAIAAAEAALLARAAAVLVNRRNMLADSETPLD